MVELVTDVGVDLVNVSATDDMVAMAAWVSHDADTEDRLKEVDRVRKLIHFLYSNRHMSPFEHGVFTFKIDAPLFVAREFFRHRTASYNEVSGRYTEMKPRFYAGGTARQQEGKPGAYYFVEGTNEQTAIYLQTKRKDLKRAWRTYQQRLDAGIAKEQAREELPLSLMTQWYVTMNPRNLMQFLSLRNEKTALKEIQDVAVKMEEIFAEHMPYTYAAFVAGREAQAFDKAAAKKQVDELTKECHNLRWRTEQAEKDASALLKNISILQEAKADIESRYLDLSLKYNADFVKNKEREQDENPRDDALAKGGTIKDVTWTIPRIDNSYVISNDAARNTISTELLERIQGLEAHAAPVYNITIEVPDSLDENELRRAIANELHKTKRKMHT